VVNSRRFIDSPRWRRRWSPEHRGLDDVDAAHAVDEIDQSAVVDGDVVRGQARPGLGWVGQVMPDLARSEGIGDVDEAQTLREPGERDHGAAEALRRLMTAAHRRLRAAVAVEARHLAGCD